MDTFIDLEDAMPLLADSPQVRECLRTAFPDYGDETLKLMRRRDLANPLGYEIQTVLEDAIENEAEVVWSGMTFGYEEEDEYPMEIRHYGGVYQVWAQEHGAEGYFLSFLDAKAYLDWNWPEAFELSDSTPYRAQALLDREREQARGAAYRAALALPASEADPDLDEGVRICAGLPGGLPAFWYDAPVQVAVSLILTEYNGVYGGFNRDFGVSTVDDALLHLAGDPRNFLQYRFFPRDLSAGYLYDVDWPLLRRGISPPQPRRLIEDDGPPHWDDTLFEIRNEPVGQSGVRYLRVGGHTPELAIRNWLTCAQVLRPVFRRMQRLYAQQEQ
jgi:hypothetical protein